MLQRLDNSKVGRSASRRTGKAAGKSNTTIYDSDTTHDDATVHDDAMCDTSAGTWTDRWEALLTDDLSVDSDWEAILSAGADSSADSEWSNSVEAAFHAWVLENTDGLCSEVCLGTLDGVEPTTLQAARNRPDGHKYEEATRSEMDGHYENNTFTPCELPAGFVPISTRLVYVRKVNPDGSIRYKARLVARGFTQVAGENFDWNATLTLPLCLSLLL